MLAKETRILTRFYLHPNARERERKDQTNGFSDGKRNLTITANICAVRFSGVSLGSRPVIPPFDAFFDIPAPSKS